MEFADEGTERKEEKKSITEECCDWELMSTCSQSSGKLSVQTLHSGVGESGGNTPGISSPGEHDVGVEDILTCDLSEVAARLSSSGGDWGQNVPTDDHLHVIDGMCENSEKAEGDIQGAFIGCENMSSLSAPSELRLECQGHADCQQTLDGTLATPVLKTGTTSSTFISKAENTDEGTNPPANNLTDGDGDVLCALEINPETNTIQVAVQVVMTISELASEAASEAASKAVSEAVGESAGEAAGKENSVAASKDATYSSMAVDADLSDIILDEQHGVDQSQSVTKRPPVSLLSNAAICAAVGAMDMCDAHESAAVNEADLAKTKIDAWFMEAAAEAEVAKVVEEAEMAEALGGKEAMATEDEEAMAGEAGAGACGAEEDWLEWYPRNCVERPPRVSGMSEDEMAALVRYTGVFAPAMSASLWSLMGTAADAMLECLGMPHLARGSSWPVVVGCTKQAASSAWRSLMHTRKGRARLKVGVAYTMMGFSLYMTFRFASRLRAKEAEAASLLAEVKRLQDLLGSKGNPHHKFHSSISRPFVPGMEWSQYGGPSRNLSFTTNHVF
mmetsp:Transcript_17548/g.38260  ORF Transcript_17548/g.38260 Transcript_17548/m.38260 type:complete len:561 (-) Transcript_17548:526-2208(-)|eukprot:CAMPEP_0118934382 /NCGR_PEP_ID=MMETSP1169-20130426/13796_1 /TAXON_ID=36882 /ORGANISM="Pyramimonas obovata, Strain CCMP722" /LENGTH=560 /DNA_ID=CAMNT_0006877285 /DNA_START=262 /DNA_END=1944 /DNA_ORIENTATION=+